MGRRKASVVKEKDYVVNLKSIQLFLFLGTFLLVLGSLMLFGNNFEITGNSISGIIGGINDFFGINAISSGTYVSRSFLTSEYTSGSAITIKLTVNIAPSDKIINYGIEEFVPVGWTINSINSTDYYSFNNGVSPAKISWIVNSSNSTSYLLSRTLYYTVTPDASSGVKTFASNIIFTSTSSGSASSDLGIIQGNISINSVAGSTGTTTSDSQGSKGGSSNDGSDNGIIVTNSSSNAGEINDPLINDPNAVVGDDSQNVNDELIESPKGEESKFSPMTYVIFMIIFVLVAATSGIIYLLKNKDSAVENLS